MCKQMSTSSIRGCVSKPVWFIVGSEEDYQNRVIQKVILKSGLRKSLTPGAFELLEQLE